jgi:CubicO group peptidase (beta-lactamase class C family)
MSKGGRMPEVHGFCDDRFRELDVAFRSNLDAGVDKGASLAATLHGKPVVDLWGGWRDYRLEQPWVADTLVRVMSTTKLPVITAVLMLVDRGLLDLDAPIALYWPEFARNGKGAVTPRHVLVHRSGVPGFGCSFTSDELADWDHATALLEDAPLWYEPGTTSCYHAHTFGQILGEVIQRVSGVPFVEFIRRELIDPLDADFHFALTSGDEQRRVTAMWPPEQTMPIESTMANAVLSELTTPPDFTSPESLARVHPGGSGLTNARALARIGSVLAMGGELDGHRYLGRATIDEAVREQSFAIDELFGPCRYGLGFGLHSEEFPAPTPTTFHWGGYGGSFVTMDMASGVSCAFAPNQLMLGENRGAEPRMKALWGLLGEVCNQLT